MDGFPDMTAAKAAALEHPEPSEDAMAVAFAKENVGMLVYDHTSGTWRVWSDGRWTLDSRERAFNDART